MTTDFKTNLFTDMFFALRNCIAKSVLLLNMGWILYWHVRLVSSLVSPLMGINF